MREIARHRRNANLTHAMLAEVNTHRTLAKALEERLVVIAGELDDLIATATIASLLYLEDRDPRVPVVLAVDSPGGLVTATLAIIDAIQQLRCPVHTHVHGSAGGAAAVVVACGRPGHRRATRTSSFALRRSKARRVLDPAIAEIEIERVDARLAAKLANAIGRSLEATREEMATERNLSAEEARKLGLIDEVASLSRLGKRALDALARNRSLC